MNAMLDQFFNVAIMAQALPIMLRGLGWTFVLCVVAVP